jgi:integrase
MVTLKYLKWDVDRHGNRRCYFRRPGQRKFRLRSEPGTQDFLDEYYSAMSGKAWAPDAAPPKQRVKAGTLEWLVGQYVQSPKFRGLDPVTQRTQRNILLDCCAEPLEPGSAVRIGDCPLEHFGAAHARTLRDRKADKPGAARNRLKWLSALFSWAIEEDRAATNPAKGVRAIEFASEGFHTWGEHEVAQFAARHPVGTKAHLALALMLYTGARRSDAVLFGRQHVRDGWLVYTQHKTRKRNTKPVEIPVLPILQAVIDASPTGDLTFLVTERGKPFTANGFGNWFRKRCDEAGLRQCSAHGLRKAGATVAAENGATEQQLMAIFGWESARQATTYTRKARRKRLAGAAMHYLARDAK